MIKFGLALASALVFAGTAHAAITIDTVSIAGTGQTTIKLDSINETALAGLVKLSSGATDYLGFCVDVPHMISTGSGQKLPFTFAKLTTDFAGHTLTTGTVNQIFGLAALGRAASTSSSDAGAIQQAIWTIEYPEGSFTAHAGFDQSRVAYFVGLAPSLHASGKVLQSADGHQSFAVAAVPEPASWAMMLTGFALVGMTTRRRQTVVAA